MCVGFETRRRGNNFGCQNPEQEMNSNVTLQEGYKYINICVASILNTIIFISEYIHHTKSYDTRKKNFFLTEQKYHSELRLQKQSFLFYLYKDELK